MEPGNSKMENKGLPLLKAVFGWARSTNPSQPVTAGIWNRKLIDIERVILDTLISSHFITMETRPQ